MSRTLDFWFDFSSPYAFLASQLVEDLAARHQRTVRWRPFLLGVILKETGAAPLTQVPLKGEYSKRDFARSARFHGLSEFRMPPRFPIPTQAPARVVLWQRERDPSKVPALVHAFFRAYFGEGRDISDPEVASDVAAAAGLDRAAARAAIDDAGCKEALKRETAEAIAAGVCGAPFVVVDGEPFWGLDRFAQVERWLATGGF
jgi:2-hydroxychromene-2-carboxylate isomerase